MTEIVQLCLPASMGNVETHVPRVNLVVLMHNAALSTLCLCALWFANAFLVTEETLRSNVTYVRDLIQMLLN